MTPSEAYVFMRGHPLAVLSTVAPDGAPQAALVGIAVTEELRIVFDTQASSRKYRNLSADPRVALVIGWDHEATFQYEGLARTATEPDLLELYFDHFPDGRDRARTAGIVHVVVEPRWIRFSDFDRDPPCIEEMVIPGPVRDTPMGSRSRS